MVAEELLSKLQKIAALAERGGTPEEAAAATAKLGELLLKHNLSMADLDGRPIAGTRKYEAKTYDLGASGFRRTLWGVVARYNFCRVLVFPRSKFSVVVGEAHNVAAVVWLAQHVEAQLNPMAAEAYDQYELTCLINRAKPVGARGWMREFRLGAVAVIAHRLKEQRQAQLDSAPTSALVIVVEDELQKAVDQMFGKTHKGGKPSIKNNGAFAAGMVAGHKVGFETSLAAKETKRLPA